MTRFSVSGDDEEEEYREGPSSLRSHKRRRSYSFHSSESGDDYAPQPLLEDEEEEEEEEEGYEEEEEEEEEDAVDLEGVEEEEVYEEKEGYVSELWMDPSPLPVPTDGSSVATNTDDKSISVVLTDPDVLDCCICFEPLSIPVFQCENGHIACSSCCTKISYKCPSCSWPIGYNRCRAIEKVLESVKIACQNVQYGCKEAVSFSEKKDHERTCTYSPCLCPLRTCDFVSSSKQLYQHFRRQHMDSSVRFDYNSSFNVTLKDHDDFLVLQERNDNVLFILNSDIETCGNLVWVSCIWPCSFKGFFYHLLAKTKENSLRLQSFTNCTRAQVGARPSTGFLLIPRDLFGSGGQLELDLCIRRDEARPVYYYA